MIVEITGLDVLEGMGRNGKPYEFLQVSGNKFDRDGNATPWTKKVVPEDQRALFAPFKIGDKVQTTNQKNAKGFWDIVDVQPHGSASAVAKPATAQAQAAKVSAPAPVSTSVESSSMSPEELVRYEALDTAVTFMTALLQANEKYKGLFKATVTADLLEADLLEMADKFGRYIRGEIDSDVSVNDGDLDDEPASDVDDDVPF